MFLYKEIKKEVAKKQEFFNDYLEVEEDVEVGSLYLQYNFDMEKDRYRIILYPRTNKGKIIFYCSSQYMSTFYESMAKQFKEYCLALKDAEETEEEYRRIWNDVTGMYGGPFLIKVDFSKKFIEEQTGNNILAILDEKQISIREMAIALNRDYAGMHRLVNRESLDTTKLGTLVEIAEYLNVDIQDLYK